MILQVSVFSFQHNQVSNEKNPGWLGYIGDEILPNYLARWWFQTFFFFTPTWGFMIQFDEHMFQMGWNHHLDRDYNKPWHKDPVINQSV